MMIKINWLMVIRDRKMLSAILAEVTPLIYMVSRHFANGHFANRHFANGHFANLIFFSSKLKSYYHKPHDNDSTKVLYNKISNTLVLCRCISLESSCTTYIWTMPPYLLRVASIVPHWLNLFIGSPLGSNRLVLCRCITLESSSECLARLG